MILTYITGSAGATLGFPRRFTVRAEVLVGATAPVGSTGEFVLLVSVIEHFLAAQVAAGNIQFGKGVFGGVHGVGSQVWAAARTALFTAALTSWVL